MKRVCVICEGQTEETFVREVLAPYFYDLNLSLLGQTVETSIRISREFELKGTEAIIHKKGDKLIIELVKKKSLKALLASLPMLDEDFPEIVDLPIEAEDIF